MLKTTFEWSVAKATANERKHHVSFEEAKTVFYDEHALVVHDPEHSDDEDRFVILGLSVSTRLLVVVHCYHEENGVIRVISARKATKRESKQYHEG